MMLKEGEVYLQDPEPGQPKDREAQTQRELDQKAEDLFDRLVTYSEVLASIKDDLMGGLPITYLRPASFALLLRSLKGGPCSADCIYQNGNVHLSIKLDDLKFATCISLEEAR